MMERMSENGGVTADQPATSRSRLTDHAEMSEHQPVTGDEVMLSQAYAVTVGRDEREGDAA
jgi:hypothetical protein